MGRENVVAVSGDVAEAGAIVYWTLSGPVEYGKLVEAWTAAGFAAGDVVEPPNPQTACLRALNEERSERSRRLRRPLEGRRGHALVDESAQDRELEYEVRCRADVDALGRIRVETADAELQARVEAAYRRHLFSELSTCDVSGWLAGKLLARVDAVALRPTGGFYFVPREGVATWRALIGVIKACSNHAFYEVPAMHTEEAIDAILAAVTAEARSEADGMWEELASGKLGERALEARAERAARCREKVERYERLLGIGIGGLCEQLTKLRADFCAAAIRANATKSGELAGLAELC